MKIPRLRQITIGALAATAATMPFSVRLCHWSFLLFVLCWVVEGNWQAKWSSLKENPVAWLLPTFFLLHIAGMFYSSNPAAGWLQLEKKAAFVLVPLTLASTSSLSRKELGSIVRVFIISCVVAGLYCVGHSSWAVFNGLPQNNFGAESLEEFLRLNPEASPVWMSFSYISLASGIGAHPTYLGLYMVLCLLLILFFFQTEEVHRYERVAGKFIFLFLLLFIFFLSSRIITISAVVVTLFGVALRVRQRFAVPAFAVQAGVAIVLLLVVYINPVSRYRGLQEPAAISLARLPDYAVTSLEIRLSLLKLSAIAGKAVSPWIGSGTGTAEDRLHEAGNQHGMSNSLGSFDPHNQFIYTFLELGLLGLATLAGVMAITLWTSWKRKSLTSLGLLLVFIATCLTESVLELQKGIILFAFFGSLLLFHEVNRRAIGNPNG